MRLEQDSKTPCEQEVNPGCTRVPDDLDLEIRREVDQIERDEDAVKVGKERIARVLRGEIVDYLPIVCGIPAMGQTGYRRFSLEEQFYDERKMLFEHIPAMQLAAESGSDGQVCIRPNLGVVFMPSLLGLGWRFRVEGWPWPEGRLSKEESLDLMEVTLAGGLAELLQRAELMSRAERYMSYFKQVLEGKATVYLPDTQGPFDLAHILYGDDLFIDMYDDPGFVKNLMEFTTTVYIEATSRLKLAAGERLSECRHGHGMCSGIYMDSGGVRISEDSATLISPKFLDEFVIPYEAKCLEPFGGGFVHYCGRNDGFFDRLLDLDLIRAINLGNPERHDLKKVVTRLKEKGKAYFGMIPRHDGEELTGYLSRVLDLTAGEKRGLVFVPDPAVYSEAEPRRVVQLWRELQVARS